MLVIMDRYHLLDSIFGASAECSPHNHTAARFEFKSCLRTLGLRQWFELGQSYSKTRECGLYSAVAPNILNTLMKMPIWVNLLSLYLSVANSLLMSSLLPLIGSLFLHTWRRKLMDFPIDKIYKQKGKASWSTLSHVEEDQLILNWYLEYESMLCPKPTIYRVNRLSFSFNEVRFFTNGLKLHPDFWGCLLQVFKTI